MRFRFLGSRLGCKLYGDTIGRYAFLVISGDKGFSASYRDLHSPDQSVSHAIGGVHEHLNDARLACEDKLRELTG